MTFLYLPCWEAAALEPCPQWFSNQVQGSGLSIPEVPAEHLLETCPSQTHGAELGMGPSTLATQGLTGYLSHHCDPAFDFVTEARLLRWMPGFRLLSGNSDQLPREVSGTAGSHVALSGLCQSWLWEALVPCTSVQWCLHSCPLP